MYIRISMRGMLRLTRVETLRRDHNVGFFRGKAHMISMQAFRLRLPMFSFYPTVDLISNTDTIKSSLLLCIQSNPSH